MSPCSTGAASVSVTTAPEMVTALLAASATVAPFTVTENALASGTEFGSSGSEKVSVSVAPLTWDAVTVGSVVSGTAGVLLVTVSPNAPTALVAASWSGVAFAPVGGV